MSEILVESSASYPGSVVVPEDGDARNAASVVVGFQALANRFAYLKAKVLDALISGGTWVLGGPLTISLVDAGIEFIGDGDFLLKLGAGALFDCNGNLVGPLVKAGTTGRPNRKVKAIATGAGTTDIDPILWNTYYVTPSATGSVRIMPSATAVAGDWVTVVNLFGSSTVQVLSPVSGDLGTLRFSNGNHYAGTYVYDGTLWQMEHRSPFTA